MTSNVIELLELSANIQDNVFVKNENQSEL